MNIQNQPPLHGLALLNSDSFILKVDSEVKTTDSSVSSSSIDVHLNWNLAKGLETIIFPFLDARSLSKIAQVSRSFALLSRENRLWKKLCQLEAIADPRGGHKNFKLIYTERQDLPYRQQQAYIRTLTSERGPKAHTCLILTVVIAIIVENCLAWIEFGYSRPKFYNQARQIEIDQKSANFNFTQAYWECGGDRFATACTAIVNDIFENNLKEIRHALNSKYENLNQSGNTKFAPLLLFNLISIFSASTTACFLENNSQAKIIRVLNVICGIANISFGSWVLTGPIPSVAAPLSVGLGGILLIEGIVKHQEISRHCRKVCGRTSSLCVRLSACFHRVWNGVIRKFS